MELQYFATSLFGQIDNLTSSVINKNTTISLGDEIIP